MEIVIRFVLKMLEWINQATADTVGGFFAVTKIAAVLTPIFYIYDKISNWAITNQDYILIVMGAIMVDWVFGTIKHIFFTKTFTWKRNAVGLTTKIALAVAGGFLFEGLNYLVSEAEWMVTSTKIMTRIIILMYPGLSAFENIYVVSGEKFPPKAWMERLQRWNKTLDPHDLIDNNNKK